MLTTIRSARLAGETAGQETAISVRQHEITLATAAPASANGNVVPATVVRNVFLGNSRDYMVELPDAAQVRVVTKPEENVEQGTKIWLHLPPDRCRALMS